MWIGKFENYSNSVERKTSCTRRVLNFDAFDKGGLNDADDPIRTLQKMANILIDHLFSSPYTAMVVSLIVGEPFSVQGYLHQYAHLFRHGVEYFYGLSQLATA